MKIKYLLSVLLCFGLLYGITYGQGGKRSNASTQIKALKLGPKMGNVFSSISFKAIKYDNGVLRPAKGYTIQRHKGSKGFLILPNGMAPAEALANAATSKDLPGGVKLRCIGCSNCQVTVLAEDGQGNKNYGCAGNCPTHGCDAMVQVPAGSVVESIF